jgi:uncharacterized membrane protein YeaQ/YmgE (transglycosylase-associated protein family)
VATVHSTEGNDMGIISWIVLGAIMGFAANRVVPGEFPGGALGTTAGGVAGSFLGGAVFSLVANRGVAGFDVVSLLIAFIGAALLLTVVRKAGHAEPRTH